MSESPVRIDRDGTRARVTLNRPATRNAFDAATIEALQAAFAQLGGAGDVRTIVLSGEGPAFSSGADAGWMAASLGLSEAENQHEAQRLAAMLRTIDRCPKPVIARVHGAALGGGAGLVAVADIAVATPEARFGFPEVKLGLIPAVIAPFAIAKIGTSAARALFLTGERIDAAHAQRIGLVHHVVAPDALDACVAAIVDQLHDAGPQAVAAAKALVRDVVAAPDASAFTTRAIAERRVSPEAQEGLRAFLERRSPGWRSR